MVNRVEAGNIYVNRNIIGAVVGVQPFGGSGLSGTGPKAGGPLYLGRLLGIPAQTALRGLDGAGPALANARAYAEWLRSRGHEDVAERVVGYLSRSVLGAQVELPGPAGERNLYALRQRGEVIAAAQTVTGLLTQLGAILATGNRALVKHDPLARAALGDMPATLAASVRYVADWRSAEGARAVLFEGEPGELRLLAREIAERDGAILPIFAISSALLARGEDYDLNRLLEECVVSTNTAAAGGNASLMSIG